MNKPIIKKIISVFLLLIMGLSYTNGLGFGSLVRAEAATHTHTSACYQGAYHSHRQSEYGQSCYDYERCTGTYCLQGSEIGSTTVVCSHYIEDLKAGVAQERWMYEATITYYQAECDVCGNTSSYSYDTDYNGNNSNFKKVYAVYGNYYCCGESAGTDGPYGFGTYDIECSYIEWDEYPSCGYVEGYQTSNHVHDESCYVPHVHTIDSCEYIGHIHTSECTGTCNHIWERTKIETQFVKCAGCGEGWYIGGGAGSKVHYGCTKCDATAVVQSDFCIYCGEIDTRISSSVTTSCGYNTGDFVEWNCFETGNLWCKIGTLFEGESKTIGTRAVLSEKTELIRYRDYSDLYGFIPEFYITLKNCSGLKLKFTLYNYVSETRQDEVYSKTLNVTSDNTNTWVYDSTYYDYSNVLLTVEVVSGTPSADSALTLKIYSSGVTSDNYNQGCWYHEVGENGGAVCDKVVTNLVPLEPVQTIVAGHPINNKATATFLDGHTEVVACKVDGYDSTLYNTTQTVTFSYGIPSQTS